MEENNNQEVVNTEENVSSNDVAVEESSSLNENEVNNVENTSVSSQSDFVTADQIGGTPLKNVSLDGTPLSQKKSVNKTLIIVIVFVVVFGGVMLLMKFGDNDKNNNNNDGQQNEEKIKVDTGTEWGDKYLTYLMTSKKDLKTYEVSFINVNSSEEPEMFVKYIDNSNKESLRIFYIANDGYVYESKYYRDFRIRYIYSLKDKTIDWYLYLTTTKNYGSYTKINKIIDNMAFDADIKTTNDALLIEYGKKYYDTDYKPTFYNIKEFSMEDDFKNFVSKYVDYNDEVKKLENQVLEKYKDYVYVEEEKEKYDTVVIAGSIYKYGSYVANIPASPIDNIPEHVKVITLLRNNKITVDGVLYDYTVDKQQILFGNNGAISLKPEMFNYQGYDYIYMDNQ